MNNPHVRALHDRLADVFRSRSAHPFWISASQTVTYGSLEAQISGAQSGLTSMGVEPGTYVAIAIENERDEDLNDGALPQLPAGNIVLFSLKKGKLSIIM